MEKNNPEQQLNNLIHAYNKENEKKVTVQSSIIFTDELEQLDLFDEKMKANKEKTKSSFTKMKKQPILETKIKKEIIENQAFASIDLDVPENKEFTLEDQKPGYLEQVNTLDVLESPTKNTIFENQITIHKLPEHVKDEILREKTEHAFIKSQKKLRQEHIKESEQHDSDFLEMKKIIDENHGKCTYLLLLMTLISNTPYFA